tara:strand:- start:1919 stop:2338 length:420 start_codon:yes stop_codon:yes gene_type:complete
MRIEKGHNDPTTWEFDLRTAFRDAVGLRLDQVEDQVFINNLIDQLKGNKTLELGPAAETLYQAFGPQSPYRGHHHLWTRIKRIIVMVTALERLGIRDQTEKMFPPKKARKEKLLSTVEKIKEKVKVKEREKTVLPFIFE